MKTRNRICAWEVAEDLDVPLGTLKRYLRDGLAQLREDFDRLETD